MSSTALPRKPETASPPDGETHLVITKPKPPDVIRDVRLIAPIICGGQTTSLIELHARSKWSVCFDEELARLWVYLELPNGKIAKSWTPYLNVLFVQFQPSE